MKPTLKFGLSLVVSILLICIALAEVQSPQIENLPVTVKWTGKTQNGNKFIATGSYTLDKQGVTLTSGEMFVLPQSGGEAVWQDTVPKDGSWKATQENIPNGTYWALGQITFKDNVTKFANTNLFQFTVQNSNNPPVPPITIAYDEKKIQLNGSTISAMGNFTVNQQGVSPTEIRLFVVSEKVSGIEGFADADFDKVKNIWGKNNNGVWSPVEVTNVPPGSFKAYARVRYTVGGAVRYSIASMEPVLVAEEIPFP